MLANKPKLKEYNNSDFETFKTKFLLSKSPIRAKKIIVKNEMIITF